MARALDLLGGEPRNGIVLVPDLVVRAINGRAVAAVDEAVARVSKANPGRQRQPPHGLPSSNIPIDDIFQQFLPTRPGCGLMSFFSTSAAML